MDLTWEAWNAADVAVRQALPVYASLFGIYDSLDGRSFWGSRLPPLRYATIKSTVAAIDTFCYTRGSRIIRILDDKGNDLDSGSDGTTFQHRELETLRTRLVRLGKSLPSTRHWWTLNSYQSSLMEESDLFDEIVVMAVRGAYVDLWNDGAWNRYHCLALKHIRFEAAIRYLYREISTQRSFSGVDLTDAAANYSLNKVDDAMQLASVAMDWATEEGVVKSHEIETFSREDRRDYPWRVVGLFLQARGMMPDDRWADLS